MGCDYIGGDNDSVMPHHEDVQGSTQQKKAGKRSKAGKDWQWSPLKEGSWHPDFAVDKVTVAEAKQAVQHDEARRAAERGSGSADEADPIQTGKMSRPASPSHKAKSC